MKVVFVSNYFNHHQESFSLAMDRLTEGNYRFIATDTVGEERLKLGYADMNKKYPWIVRAYESDETMQRAEKLIDEADAVIIGSAPSKMIEKRLQEKKLVFRYAERLYKYMPKWYTFPLRILKHSFLYNRKNYYLLCSSAYTAADFAKSCAFLNKAYKWAYFPAVKEYKDINDLIESKKKNSILWVGRLIDWKHPEAAVEVARRLKQDGYAFELNVIGTGEMETELKEKILSLGLEERVRMLGSMPPESVRRYMEESEIFLFTSDRNEGWGAVLNESMNSGCAVVASHAIGSVPYLVKDGENGYIYKDGIVDDLYEKVKTLLDACEKRKKTGKNAYETTRKEWNAENAARRFLVLAKAILDGEKHPYPFADGVCSKAEILKDDWYLKQ